MIFSKESLTKTVLKSGLLTVRSYSHDKSVGYSLKQSLNAKQQETDKPISLSKFYLVKFMSMLWFLSALFDVNRGEEIFLVAKVAIDNEE